MKLTNKAKGYLGVLLLVAQLTNLIPPNTVHAQTSGTWSTTFDLTASDGGFVFHTGNGTSPGWQNGQGWYSGSGGFEIWIDQDVPGGDGSTIITNATVYAHSDVVTATNGVACWYNCVEFIGNPFVLTAPFNYSGDVTSYSGSISAYGNQISIRATTHDDGSGGSSGSGVTIYRVQIQGTGTPPDWMLDPTAVPPVTMSNTASCKYCVYSPIGDWAEDLPALMDYVICNINNVYYCIVIPILMGLWNTVFKILIYMQSVMFYGISVGNNAVGWANGNATVLARYATGEFENGVTRITESVAWSNSNAYVIQSGGGGSNIFDVLKAIVDQLGGAFQGLYTLFNTLITSIKELLNSILGGGTSIIIALIGAFFNLVIVIVNAILWVLSQVLQVVGIIPQFVSEFTGAYSETVTMPTIGPDDLFAPAVDGVIQVRSSGLRSFVQAPNSYVANCDNQIMYHVCLAWYVIDNTVYNNSDAPGLLSVFTPGLALTVLMVVAAISMFIRWIKRFSAALGFG